jgi:hypothetical protein
MTANQTLVDLVIEGYTELAKEAISHGCLTEATAVSYVNSLDGGNERDVLFKEFFPSCYGLQLARYHIAKQSKQ